MIINKCLNIDVIVLGSSNSQDSFPSGGGSGSMDGYGYGYPPSDYNNQRPPSQSNPGNIIH